MGEKVKKVGHNFFTILISAIGGVSSLCVAIFLFVMPSILAGGGSNVRFTGDVRILYAAGILAFIIFIFFLFFFVWSIPKYRFVIFEHGLEVKRKGSTRSILFKDIEDLVEIPHAYGFSIAVALRAKDDPTWYYMDIKNSGAALGVLAQTYTASVYPELQERLDGGETLAFKYFPKITVSKRKFLGGKLEKYLNSPTETITLNTQTLVFGNKETSVGNIADIVDSKLVSKITIMTKTNEEFVSFAPFSIFMENCFLHLLQHLLTRS